MGGMLNICRSHEEAMLLHGFQWQISWIIITVIIIIECVQHKYILMFEKKMLPLAQVLYKGLHKAIWLVCLSNVP